MLVGFTRLMMTLCFILNSGIFEKTNEVDSKSGSEQMKMPASPFYTGRPAEESGSYFPPLPAIIHHRQK